MAAAKKKQRPKINKTLVTVKKKLWPSKFIKKFGLILGDKKCCVWWWWIFQDYKSQRGVQRKSLKVGMGEVLPNCVGITIPRC